MGMEIDYTPGYEWRAEVVVEKGNEAWYWRTEDAELLFEQ